MVSFTWSVVDSPVGKLLLVRSPEGLVRIAFEAEDFDRQLALLSGGTREAEDPQTAAQLTEYFAGARRTFSLPLDWRLTAGFRGRVQRALLDIPYGATATYADLARRLGNPHASRAVGSGCARNPLPIVAPCHRVTRSDGSLGGYLAGAGVKKQLIDLEASHV